MKKSAAGLLAALMLSSSLAACASEDTVGFFAYSGAPLYYFYGAGERISTCDAKASPR